MTCANTLLSILAIVNFLFVVWPKFGGATWVVLITSVLTLIIAWTMVECKACKSKPIRPAPSRVAPAKPQKRRKRK